MRSPTVLVDLARQRHTLAYAVVLLILFEIAVMLWQIVVATGRH